jgi:hypothetical protein
VRPCFAIASLFVFCLTLCGQAAKDSPATMPKEGQDALKASVTKIAKSYSKPDWPYKIVALQKGKIDPMWRDMNRMDVYCAVIDPMIPTYTDWKIGNFVIYREQGALWIAEEGDKDTFLRLSCKNWKDPVAK